MQWRKDSLLNKWLGNLDHSLTPDTTNSKQIKDLNVRP